MVVVYCYLEKRNHKLLKFHVNMSSYLEISVSFFEAPPSNKRHILNL